MKKMALFYISVFTIVLFNWLYPSAIASAANWQLVYSSSTDPNIWMDLMTSEKKTLKGNSHFYYVLLKHYLKPDTVQGEISSLKERFPGRNWSGLSYIISKELFYEGYSDSGYNRGYSAQRDIYSVTYYTADGHRIHNVYFNDGEIFWDILPDSVDEKIFKGIKKYWK